MLRNWNVRILPRILITSTCFKALLVRQKLHKVLFSSFCNTAVDQVIQGSHHVVLCTFVAHQTLCSCLVLGWGLVPLRLCLGDLSIDTSSFGSLPRLKACSCDCKFPSNLSLNHCPASSFYTGRNVDCPVSLTLLCISF